MAVVRMIVNGKEYEASGVAGAIATLVIEQAEEINRQRAQRVECNLSDSEIEIKVTPRPLTLPRKRYSS